MASLTASGVVSSLSATPITSLQQPLQCILATAQHYHRCCTQLHPRHDPPCGHRETQISKRLCRSQCNLNNSPDAHSAYLHSLTHCHSSTWYGTFSNGQRSTIHDFLASISSAQPKPSANSWWKLTEGYKTTDGNTVAGSLSLAAELSDSVYSKGKSLTEADLETLILSSLGTFPTNPHAIYMLLTASDVTVENFCMNSCASHFATSPSNATHGQQLPFVWVGNAATQCPGNCAWPFARAEYGPPTAPLLPPNGDVGIDGMIINIGSMLAGTATNPFNNGYYQGDGGAPLEAATACAGIYGPGAYPGYPGDLLTDKTTGASYNANGIKNRTFLLPALWDPSTLLCTPP